MQGKNTRQQGRRNSAKFKPAKLLSLFLLAFLIDANACGWNGDVESKYDTMLPEIASGGRNIPQTLDLESTRLPENLGFGMVITEPSQAVPYLQSTFGRPIRRIEDLRAFGVRAVVDLGGHDGISNVKPVDTSSQELHFYKIPLASTMPGAAQIGAFHDLLLDPANLPLFVIAPRAEILAVTWTAYRLKLGTPLAYAIYEGKSIGLQSGQESLLLELQR